MSGVYFGGGNMTWELGILKEKRKSRKNKELRGKRLEYLFNLVVIAEVFRTKHFIGEQFHHRHGIEFLSV